MPKSYKTIIIDDEVLARKRLSSLLASQSDFELIQECANGIDALAAINSLQPDLIFLDIQMPDLDGFGVVQQLSADHLPLIIFVTAYDQYALKAFEVHAVDYLLKPFDDDRFYAALDHVRAQLKRPEENTINQKIFAMLAEIQSGNQATNSGQYLKRIALKSAGTIHFVRTEEIEWIEAAGIYIKLHCGKRTHLMRQTMQQIESQLNPEHFLRIHRSTIINIDAVKSLHPHDHGEYIVRLANGVELKLSRNYRDRLDVLLGNSPE